MRSFDEKFAKLVTKRKGEGDAVADAAILLETICALQGGRVCPRGVYLFNTFEEADQWALEKIAATPAPRN